MLKISAFYLVKQKNFIPKKNFLGRCQYQNKKALFTDPIFSEGFGVFYSPVLTLGSVCGLLTGGSNFSVIYFLESIRLRQLYLQLSFQIAENTRSIQTCNHYSTRKNNVRSILNS